MDSCYVEILFKRKNYKLTDNQLHSITITQIPTLKYVAKKFFIL